MPLYQLPATTMEDSGIIVSSLWLAMAGALSLVTPRIRQLPLGWVLMVLSAVVLRIFLVDWPTVQTMPFASRWGLLGVLGTVGVWMGCFAWGTQAVLHHSPPVHRQLHKVMLGVLCLWGLGTWLYTHGLYNRWVHYAVADHGGFLSSGTVLSAWYGIGVAVIWPWSRWASLLAWHGAWQANRLSIWVALGAWAAWECWRSSLRIRLGKWRWLPRLSVTLTACAFLWALGAWHDGWDGVRLSVIPRLQTWPAVLRTIATHPLGIGWSPIAYQHEVLSTVPIMGHPSSSLLHWVLRCGWPLGVVLLWMGWWGWRNLGHSKLDGALVMIVALALIQRTVAMPHVGMLAWSIVCAWLIERSPNG